MSFQELLLSPEPFTRSYTGDEGPATTVSILGLKSAYAMVEVDDPANPDNVFLLTEEEFLRLHSLDTPMDQVERTLRASFGTVAHRADGFRGITSRETGAAQDKIKQLEQGKSTKDEENSLQTAHEAMLYNATEVIAKVSGIMKDVAICGSGLNAAGLSTSTFVEHPENGRKIPVTRDVYACMAGNILLTRSVEVLFYQMLGFDAPGGIVRSSQYRARVTHEQDTYINQVMESTKIGVGISYVMFPDLDPLQQIQLNKDGAAIGKPNEAKKGAPVHDKGKPKKDAQGVGLHFNASYLKQYYELTLRAHYRFAANNELVSVTDIPVPF